MAIVGLPGWIGSSAANETGQRWMSAARTALQLSGAGYMSQLAGRSSEINLTVYASDNYNPDTLLNQIYSYGANGGGNSFVVTVVGDIVAYSSGVPCLNFPGNLNAPYIRLVIGAGVTVYGRGGNGGAAVGDSSFGGFKGNSAGGGGAGGPAITNGIGTRLLIQNNGAIAGGGGGGGAALHFYDNGDYEYSNWYGGGVSGSGGRPFGGAGSTNRSWLTAGYGASKAAPGSARNVTSTFTSSTGGAGGGVGSSGGAGATGKNGSRYTAGGGAGGAALNGSAPTWEILGAIYGARL